ncbi:MAG: glycosyltransferase family 4 protein [candidate division KSB1 bacterium]|nr:glycosyltransferase family 4 protein [candidate division KSB1 bacterium]
MNLLFLTYQGGGAGSTYSIHYLASGLAERGHKVYVGCPKESLLYRLVSQSRATAIGMRFRSKTDRSNIRHIRNIVKSRHIQLINAQSGKDRYTSILANWLYALHCPVVHTRRQIPASSGIFLQNWFYTHGTRQIVAVSYGVRDALVELGIPPSHITVIHNGTPPEKYKLEHCERINELKTVFNIQPDTTILGCVSRKKQQEQLLQALKHLNRPVTLFLIGVTERPEYKQITNQYTLPHTIHYLGHIEQKDALYYYKLFDIKILPSVTEGVSQAILEAMALNVPVIATRAAGNIDIIQDGVNGLFFEAGDCEGLARTIEKLLHDKKLYKKLSRNGCYTATETFSIQETIRKYEQFFENLIKTP